MAKTKKNKRGLSEAVTKKKSGVTKLNPFDVRTVRYICLNITCCGSGMFIADSDLYQSQISDPIKTTKGEGWKVGCVIFFCSHKFHTYENYLLLNRYRKHLSQLTKNYSFFYSQKIVTKLSKTWVGNPGFGKKSIPNLRVKEAPGPQHS